MSNQTDISDRLPPPSGGPDKADHYLTQLINLISTDKLLISHTDLSRFDPSSLQDHYKLTLKDYEIEISHSKQPNSGKDYYVILFNNLKLASQNSTEKIILAYIHITGDKFAEFKTTADDQIERKREEAEEKRFREAMAPVDQALSKLTEVNSGTNEERYEQPSDHLLNPYQIL